MNRLEQSWLAALQDRKAQGVLRTLKSEEGGIDFYSNDYLGLARDPRFQQRLLYIAQQHPKYLTGSTGSRLISGNSIAIEEVEAFLADKHEAEAALLFDSGYKANVSLFSAIANRGLTFIVDELIHRSVHDGIALGRGQKWKFRHNDLQHLEDLLRRAQGEVVVAVESLYSMDGDFAPLCEIVDLTQRYGASLIVDEAHAVGVFGWGKVVELGLQDQVLAVVATYGKAMGVSGGAVIGSQLLKDYLVNFAAGFIYSTAPSALLAHSVREAYGYVEEQPSLRAQLADNIALFRSCGLASSSDAASPIQALRFANTQKLEACTLALREEGLNVYSVYAPTVKVGEERLRLSLHSFNKAKDIHIICQQC